MIFKLRTILYITNYVLASVAIIHILIIRSYNTSMLLYELIYNELNWADLHISRFQRLGWCNNRVEEFASFVFIMLCISFTSLPALADTNTNIDACTYLILIYY